MPWELQRYHCEGSVPQKLCGVEAEQGSGVRQGWWGWEVTGDGTKSSKRGQRWEEGPGAGVGSQMEVGPGGCGRKVQMETRC